MKKKVVGANQNARKLLSTDLVNTELYYSYKRYFFLSYAERNLSKCLSSTHANQISLQRTSQPSIFFSKRD